MRKIYKKWKKSTKKLKLGEETCFIGFKMRKRNIFKHK